MRPTMDKGLRRVEVDRSKSVRMINASARENAHSAAAKEAKPRFELDTLLPALHKWLKACAVSSSSGPNDICAMEKAFEAMGSKEVTTIMEHTVDIAPIAAKETPRPRHI
jgi:hypothetical protein